MSLATRVTAATAALGLAFVLSACSSSADHTAHDDSTPTTDHSGMSHPADGGPVPSGLTPATNPTYAVGDTVVLTADHMHGMDGATATIVGAYDTYTYAVDFTPTSGGERVTDHRWVVHEELQDVTSKRLADGDQATIAASHTEGMNGARATVRSSTDATVYVVDYEADGMKMTNHKWVVESEIKPAP